MGMTDEEANLHDTLSELKRHLRSDETGKIVLIGDVMMDYIHGYANNLNSRAPVPVLRETGRRRGCCRTRCPWFAFHGARESSVWRRWR